MKIQEKVLYLITIVLLICAGSLGWLLKGKDQKLKEKENLIIALNDTVFITKNKLGQSVSKISKFETEKVSDFLKIQGLTGENKVLQEQVVINKNRLGTSGSVTVFTSDTKIDTSMATVVISKDTVRIPGQPIMIFPEYKSQIVLEKWITGNTIANRDSTHISLGIHNEYSLVIGEEPIKGTGFLGIGKKMKPFSEVTNLNPYSTTPTLRTYQVKSTFKPKKLSLGVQTGYSPINGTYIGIGIQYNLINLW